MSEQLDRIENGIHQILVILNTDPPPPTPDPDPIPDPIPVPVNLPFVTMRVKAPLMEISKYDGKDKRVLRIHKYGLLQKRIVAKPGKKLYHLGKVVTAQGVAFKLYSGQQVDGRWLTETNTRASIPGTRNPKRYDKYFYILKRLVQV